MKTDLILENISRHISPDKRETEFFLSLLVEKKLGKREFLHKDGDVCRHSAFVAEGALKGYTVDNTGGEHVLNFAVAGWWIADLYSFFSQKPGVLLIEALADSTVFAPLHSIASYLGITPEFLSKIRRKIAS